VQTSVEAFAERDVKRAAEVAEMDQKMSQPQEELFTTILGGSAADPLPADPRPAHPAAAPSG
jgi:hypothetical protein